MDIEKALRIATREWENISISLEKCGDIGEFLPENYASGSPDLPVVSEGLLLIRNLTEMENKLPIHGYFTPEAAYVFTSLASKAGKRLGFKCDLAQTFGRGYSWVRTGLFDPDHMKNQYIIKQLFFFKLFFPLGGYFNWSFNSPLIKTKFDLVFYTFLKWQETPGSYIRDVREFIEQLEPLWRGLSLHTSLPREFPEIMLPHKEQSGRVLKFQFS